MTDLNETGRVSITAGMARGMLRGAARQCPECKLGFPKYPGRYPKTCPRCKGEVPGPTDAALAESVRTITERGALDRFKALAGMALMTDAQSRQVSGALDIITKAGHDAHNFAVRSEWDLVSGELTLVVNKTREVASMIAAATGGAPGLINKMSKAIEGEIRKTINSIRAHQMTPAYESIKAHLVPSVTPTGKPGWKMTGLRADTTVYVIELPVENFSNRGHAKVYKKFRLVGEGRIGSGNGFGNQKVFHSESSTTFGNTIKRAREELFAYMEKNIIEWAKYVDRLEEAAEPVSEAEWGTGAHAITTDAAGEGFWGNAGAGVLPIAKSTGRILVSLRSKSVNEPGTWGTFGGAVDASENPRHAAQREMLEELGCCRGVELIPAYVFTSPGGGFRFSNFIGLVDDEFKPRLDWETERAEWMTYEELKRLPKKHFGMEALLKNSASLIRKHARVHESVEHVDEAKFVQGEFSARTSQGNTTLKGKGFISDDGVWAIETTKGGYYLSHIPSGAGLGGFKKRATADAVVDALDAIAGVDWKSYTTSKRFPRSVMVAAGDIVRADQDRKIQPPERDVVKGERDVAGYVKLVVKNLNSGVKYSLTAPKTSYTSPDNFYASKPPTSGNGTENSDINPEAFGLERGDLEVMTALAKALRAPTKMKVRGKHRKAKTYNVTITWGAPKWGTPWQGATQRPVVTYTWSRELGESMPVVCVSRSQRIQALIESGRKSFGVYLKDESCSRVITVSYSAISETCGSVDNLKQFFEGPVDCGFHYRVESATDPALVVEFDDKRQRARLFATRNPSRYLLIDPFSECVIEDHDATFEDHDVVIDEGTLGDTADKVIGALRKRVEKLLKFGRQLSVVQDIWDEAARDSGVPVPVTVEMRMARGLNDRMRGAFSGSRIESVEEAGLGESQLDEALGFTTLVGLFYAVVGGVPLLLAALAKATKMLGFTKAHEALKHAHQVMHHVESRIIDYTVPDRLSYAVYTRAWARGWRVAKYVGRDDMYKPVSFDAYRADDDLRGMCDGTLYKMMLLYLAVGGFVHLMDAPLSALFVADATATSVKSVEIGKGMQKAARVVAALESALPNLDMVALGAHGLYEAAPIELVSAVELFSDEPSAMVEVSSLGLDLIPSRRLIGEEYLWALVHTATGYALGRGEVSRLREVAERDAVLDEVSYASAAYSLGRAHARTRSVDQKHQRVTGEFRTEEDTRRSSSNPREPGEGLSHPIQGFRFSTTKQRHKPNKDVQKSLQNKKNAKGGNSPRKIQKHKEWHRGREGRKYHRAQAEFNKSRLEASVEVREKIMDVKDRILAYSAGQQLREDIGKNLEHPSVEDDFEALLRRLIVSQDMDVLSDVEFDNESGAVYMFFDPILRGDEIDELLGSLKQAKGEIELIASPNMSLPNEQIESDWWVFFLPGIGEDVASPDPAFYARSPEDYGTRVQMVVMGQSPDVEAIAQDVDVGKMLNAAGS